MKNTGWIAIPLVLTAATLFAQEPTPQPAEAKPTPAAPAEPAVKPAEVKPATPAPAAQAPAVPAPKPETTPAVTTPPAAPATPPAVPWEKRLAALPVLKSREFFGIYLGEPLEEVLARAKESGLDTSMTGIRYEADLHQYTEHTIKGSLDKNKSVDRVLVYCFHDRVCIVRTYFNDLRERYLDGIRKALTQKYGAAKEQEQNIYPESKEKDYDYETTVDGQKVKIQMAIFSNPQTSAILNAYLKYGYAGILDIHDDAIKEVRQRRPNEGW